MQPTFKVTFLALPFCLHLGTTCKELKSILDKIFTLERTLIDAIVILFKLRGLIKQNIANIH